MAEADNRFHHTAQEWLRRTDVLLENALKNRKINKDDAMLISEYSTRQSGSKGISPGRKYKITYVLIVWRKYLPTFRKCTMYDIDKGIEKLSNDKNAEGKAYKKNTKYDYIKFLKTFMLYLIENNIITIKKELIIGIKAGKRDRMTKTAEMLLSEEDIERLIKAAKSSRDRAIISMLYEGALRPIEIASLRWNHVKIEYDRIILNIDEKTGMPRRIPLFFSTGYFLNYKNDYLGPSTGDMLVFLTRDGLQLQHKGLTKNLKKIAKDAGIDPNKVKGHIFRHSRITHLARKNVNEGIIKRIAWGNPQSQMLSTYEHLIDADTDRELARVSGIEIPKPEDRLILAPKVCPVCQLPNVSTNRHCGRCGTPLTIEAADSLRIKQEWLEQQPEIKELLDHLKSLEDTVKKIESSQIIPPGTP